MFYMCFYTQCDILSCSISTYSFSGKILKHVQVCSNLRIYKKIFPYIPFQPLPGVLHLKPEFKNEHITVYSFNLWQSRS